MRLVGLSSILVATLLSVSASAQQAPAAAVFEKAAIVFEGRAESNGVMTVVFTPSGGDPTEINVNVLAKNKVKMIAEQIAKELTIAGGGTYQIKQSGATITIKKSKEGPGFSLQINNNVAGISTLIDI